MRRGSYVAAGMMGIALSIVGFGINTWQFWFLYLVAAVWFVSGYAAGVREYSPKRKIFTTGRIGK